MDTPKKVELTIKVGTSINEFRVRVLAWKDAANNLQVQLAPGKNGTPSEEELALRMLQRDPASVLKQVNKGLALAGVDVDVNAELLQAKVLPGPDVPLHKNDPRLTPEFLATLVVAARCGYGNDYEVEHFVKHVFNQAGVAIPDEAMLLPFTPEQLDEAEQLDGKAATVDGVMPQEDVATVQ